MTVMPDVQNLTRYPCVVT